MYNIYMKITTVTETFLIKHNIHYLDYLHSIINCVKYNNL